MQPAGRARVGAGDVITVASRRAGRRRAGGLGAARVALSLLLIAGLAGCVSPAFDAAGYRGKVRHSAQSMVGVVGTAMLAGRLELDGRLTEAVRDTVISNAENDSQSVLSAFETVQPPDHAMIALRGKADTVFQQAASDITDLRIATRAGNRAATRDSLASLRQILTKLQPLQDLA